jgi:RHS repeat-associated protein
MTGRELDGGTVFHSALFDVDKPHAIVGADANINCFPDMQSVKYNVLDKVEQITQGRYRVNFEYGYDNQRMSMTKVDNIANATYTKDYVGNCEFIDNNGNDEVRTYLAGPAGVFAVVVQKGNTTNIDYVYKDNLGSWTTIADSTKRVVERMSYDAWGNLRDATTWCGNFGRLPKYERGFTGHEHLYEFGLINMNGRMYDPMSASFLSPDSYIQDPTTQQGFNRYAYCAYNPLKYVDPSGELYFGWVNIEYMIEQEIKHKCREDQYRLYEIVTSIHELTMFMAGTLFSQGMDDFGNGSGNHGSPGGGGYSTDFINKCLELGITPGMSIPKEKQTDEFLKQFQETFFPDAPMEYVKKFVVEGLDKESEFLRGTTWNQAKTIPDWENDMFSGYSSVYFNEDIVFKNPEDLFYAMGHELVHVGQIIELAGDPRQNWCEGLAYVMDVYAYSWMGIMGRPPKYWNTNKQYTKEWQSHRSCLNYTNFPWLLNIPHP